LAYLLRKSIHSQNDRLAKPLHVVRELKLLSAVDGFMNGFYGIRKFMTTPVPFPLIQMARTFLFLYIFTVPFVLISDDSSTLAHCFTIFLLTYGFMGLEVVAIELDNPFGDDPNDFNCLALAHTAFEDIYLFTRDCDGPEWADLLLDRMRQTEASSQIGNGAGTGTGIGIGAAGIGIGIGTGTGTGTGGGAIRAKNKIKNPTYQASVGRGGRSTVGHNMV